MVKYFLKTKAAAKKVREGWKEISFKFFERKIEKLNIKRSKRDVCMDVRLIAHHA